MKTKTPQCIIPYKITDIHKAIYKALRQDDTFVAYLLPGEPLSSMKFIVDIEGREPISDVQFSISEWNTDSSERLIIHDTITVKDYLKSEPAHEAIMPSMVPCGETTDRLLYKGQVLSIVTDLAENYPSKTVLSRVICGTLMCDDTANMWLQVAHDYFKELKNTFRFIYFTPATGCWIGASPEILLNVDNSTGNAETVALAGTRTKPKANVGWDEKNVSEQGMVVKFIMDVLEEMQADYKVEAVNDVAFGNISHKCEHFTFNLGERDPFDVIDSLNPTPALSGYPREDAVAHIERLEMHNRYCYGGYVAVEDGNSLRAYVNLRCAHFYKDKYCIYAGSGLTEDSKADSEWIETENKIYKLRTAVECCDAAFNAVESLAPIK